MSESDRKLKFSNTEVLCLFGIALFLLSLALPAAKMGSGSTTGYSWFVVGTLFAFHFVWQEAENLSRVALLLNLSCLLSVIFTFTGWKFRPLRLLTVCIGSCCAAVLLLRPYSGFEEIYSGYYLWLVAAIWILLTPIVSERRLLPAHG
jgi:hypothetical protein